MLDSLLDGFFSPFSGPGRAAKRATRLLTSGEQGTARIAGIEFIPHIDAVDETRWALEIASAAGTFRAGCRLLLTPQPERALLGSSVLVRHDGATAIIDWRATLAAAGVSCDHDGVSSFKVLGEPPADGIRDRSRDGKRIERGTPVRAVVLGAERATGFLGQLRLQNWDLRLHVDGAVVELGRELVPPYAAHLLASDFPLAAALDGGDLVVDWQTSALEAAAAGVTGDIGALLERTDAVAEPASALSAGPGAAAASADDGPVEGIGFDAWVEIEAGLVRDRVAPAAYDAYAQERGVAPGRWQAVSGTWNSRVQADWTLGARYGAAFAAARKRKRRD